MGGREANLFVGKGGELEGGLRDFTGRAIVSHANLQAAGPGRNPLGDHRIVVGLVQLESFFPSCADPNWLALKRSAGRA